MALDLAMAKPGSVRTDQEQALHCSQRNLKHAPGFPLEANSNSSVAL